MSENAIIAIALAAIVLAVVFFIIVLIFKKNIKDRIQNMTKVGPGGAEFVPPGQQQAVAVAAERTPQQALTQPLPPPDPALAWWIEELEAIIDRAGLRNSPTLVDQLKYTLAMRAYPHSSGAMVLYAWLNKELGHATSDAGRSVA